LISTRLKSEGAAAVPTSKAIAGVLHDFLASFTCPGSHYREGWSFGYIVGQLADTEFDLLRSSPSVDDDDPLTAVAGIAVIRFQEILEAAGWESRN
jgi:hypothetical protein